MTDNWLTPLADFERGVAASDGRFFIGPRHGTMFTLLYAPVGRDAQAPHSQDEIYIVHRGSGVFRKGDETKPFGPGDVIFVEANAPHRFEDFTDDFAAWAVFWGPPGGEGGAEG